MWIRILIILPFEVIGSTRVMFVGHDVASLLFVRPKNATVKSKSYL